MSVSSFYVCKSGLKKIGQEEVGRWEINLTSHRHLCLWVSLSLSLFFDSILENENSLHGIQMSPKRNPERPKKESWYLRSYLTKQCTDQEKITETLCSSLVSPDHFTNVYSCGTSQAIFDFQGPLSTGTDQNASGIGYKWICTTKPSNKASSWLFTKMHFRKENLVNFYNFSL